MGDHKDSISSHPKSADWAGASRKKGPSLAGSALFTILRLLDLPLQYQLLQSSWGADVITRLRGQPVLPRLTTNVFGLSPYHALLLTLASGSSLKQIYWTYAVSENIFPVPFAVLVSSYNTLLNSVNTLLALWTLTSQQPGGEASIQAFLSTAPLSIYVGVPLYSIGLFTEWFSEVQRKRFKADPRNQGKPYSDGLFGLARNINYGGYTLWRVGYSLTCGGWVWGAVVAAWLAGDFIGRAIPSLDAYCADRVSCRKVWCPSPP